MPAAIRSDNGPPFASTGIHGACELNTWWMKLGITHQRIQPASPQQNGAHERIHRTLKKDTTRPPGENGRARSAGSTPSSSDTTTSGLTRPSTTKHPGRSGCRRLAPSPRVSCLPSTLRIARFVACRALGPSVSSASSCFSAMRSATNTSPSRRSTTDCGTSSSTTRCLVDLTSQRT